MTTAQRIDRHVYTIPDLLTPAECDAWIARTEASGYREAPVSTTGGPRMMKEVRDNARLMLDSVPEAAKLWDRLAARYPKALHLSGAPIGLNERLRFYRYEPGQRFKLHRDGYYRRPTGERSHVTFLVYLNEGFVGGETRIFDSGEHAVAPRRGMALLFAHQLMHEGVAVRDGTKYVLRSDVMYAH